MLQYTTMHDSSACQEKTTHNALNLQPETLYKSRLRCVPGPSWRFAPGYLLKLAHP